MKKLTLLLLTLCVLTLNSCKKNNDENTDSANLAVTLKVDGASKTATSTVAVLYSGSGNNTMQIISVLGGTEGLNLMMTDVKVGIFNINNNTAILSYSTTSTYSDTYLATTTGSVTVTALTGDTITGTFQFVGSRQGSTGTKTITEGSFKCKYMKQ
jgi:hypothetical protein